MLDVRGCDAHSNRHGSAHGGSEFAPLVWLLITTVDTSLFDDPSGALCIPSPHDSDAACGDGVEVVFGGGSARSVDRIAPPSTADVNS